MPLIYGHRGARGERPENTIEGFLYAQKIGVDGIETDIALTADFVPVIQHDPHLTDGRLIRDVAVASLEDIPTLAASLAALPAMHWLLEVKTFPDDLQLSHPPAVMVERLLAVLDEAPVNPAKIAIKAFDWEVLRELACQRPALRRICLTAPKTEAARDIWWGRGFEGMTTPQAVAAAGADTWSTLHKFLTAAQVREAKNLGLKVLAWTVNDQTDFDRLANLADGVITDFPSRFVTR